MATPDEPRDLAGLTILLVEDNEDSAEMLHMYLQWCGAHVAVAGTVDKALALLRNGCFHVVVTDISMPGKDGIHLLGALREVPAHRTTPAIGISGFREDYATARGAGFDAFLQKPVDLDDLCSVIKTLAEHRGQAPPETQAPSGQ